MNLPTFEECVNKVKDGTATNLDRFIYNWEPRGNDAEVFRSQLSSLLSNPELTKEMVEDAKPKRNYGWHNDHLSSLWNPKTGEYETKPFPR